MDSLVRQKQNRTHRQDSHSEFVAGPHRGGELEKVETTIAEGFKANGYREYGQQDKGYTEDFITQHAVDFIRDSKGKPSFCDVPFRLIHAPFQAKDADLTDVDPKVTDETKRTYAAMVQTLDRNVATILDELDKLGPCENTIVVLPATTARRQTEATCHSMRANTPSMKGARICPRSFIARRVDSSAARNGTASAVPGTCFRR